MARIDLIKALYKKQIPINEFKYDNLRAQPLLSYIHPLAIMEMNKIARSLKYQSKPKKKFEMIDNILKPYYFKRIAAGTNRIVYKHLEDQNIVLKVALDRVGLNDNPSEYHNQRFLKPFVTKCFEISPCGTVGIFERVQPITSRAEFKSISDDIFALLNKLIGKYILEDIGTKFFMNYGLREGFGPVLLDYPYMFELDGRKIHCNYPDPITGLPCNGEIDYDDGFNNLICTKCGKIYLATELQKDMDRNNILIESNPNEKGEIFNMKIEVVERSYDENGKVIGEEKKSELGDGFKETSSIIGKKEYESGMKVNINSSTKTKIYRNDTIKAKPKFKIDIPKVEVKIDVPKEEEMKDIPEQKKDIDESYHQAKRVEEESYHHVKKEDDESYHQVRKEDNEPISPAQRNQMRKDPLRRDVFARVNNNRNSSSNEKDNIKDNVNEDYIKNELMGKKEENEENKYEKEALDEY